MIDNSLLFWGYGIQYVGKVALKKRLLSSRVIVIA